MSEYQPSAALLRTLGSGRFGADPRRDCYFESGQGTRAATQAHLKQAASNSVDRVVTTARRQRPTTEERQKEVERRRVWGSGGNMPDKVRARYTEAERAALSVIGEQCKRKGYCDLCIDEIARVAGVSRTSVQNAIRKARSKELAHISVRERPQEHGKSLTNIIKITCDLWLGWIARAIGFKRLSTSETADKISLSLTVRTSRKGLSRKEEAAAEPSSRNVADADDERGNGDGSAACLEPAHAEPLSASDRLAMTSPPKRPSWSNAHLTPPPFGSFPVSDTVRGGTTPRFR